MSDCPVCHNTKTQFILKTADYSNTGEYFDIYDCPDCGIRFTHNPPIASESGRYYDNANYISHSDTNQGIIARLYHLIRNYMLHRKYRLIKSISKDKNLLDVGSGTGYFLNYLKNRGYNVTGVEISDKARNFGNEHFGLQVRKTVEEIADSVDYKFDFITLWHVLEHLYNPEQSMMKFHELLKSDGTLIIALPNHNSYDSNRYQNYWAGYDVPRHLWHFNTESFTKFANHNGFSVVAKYMMPFDPFYNSMLSEKYKKGSFAIINGFVTGLIAYFKGLISTDHASSVIYILKPSKH
ncbi:MAG TPA: class I SAM-dependent methyltransferase [Saprospiraceae bacterium]|nr:class I SAM-dependent methyltransferase [Saprospiraceae bacterium]HRO09109.1 class I SAM-dependent methyltransferase [Saprospiraceae bacterium]HRO72635.1 class I SAM-dependent methyltransferase [Saprospiraceae bacterium]HRP42477.1 class I SAM-dependent methyltransferase [Saprospiraceae bacterium]